MTSHGRIQRGGPGVWNTHPPPHTPPPLGILAKMCLSDSWNGTGLILHSIYVKYSHKLKKKKGSKCGDILMVRTGNVDFFCKRLTSIEIRKSKYHIIRRVLFRWDGTQTHPPPQERYLDPHLLVFFSLPTMFSTLPFREIISLATFVLLSANTFDLVESMMLFGKELTLDKMTNFTLP